MGALRGVKVQERGKRGRIVNREWLTERCSGSEQVKKHHVEVVVTVHHVPPGKGWQEVETLRGEVSRVWDT